MKVLNLILFFFNSAINTMFQSLDVYKHLGCIFRIRLLVQA